MHNVVWISAGTTKKNEVITTLISTLFVQIQDMWFSGVDELWKQVHFVLFTCK